MSDTDEIDSRLDGRIDLIVEGGRSGIEPTTVIDLTGDSPLVVRIGCGPVEAMLGKGGAGAPEMKQSARITITTSMTTKGMIISVADNGPGIAPDAADMEVPQHREQPGAERPGRVVEVALEHRPLQAVLDQVIGQRRVAQARAGDVILGHINQPNRPAGQGLADGVLALRARGIRIVRLPPPG